MNLIHKYFCLGLFCCSSVQLFAQQHSDLFFTSSSTARGFVNTTESGIYAVQGNPAGMTSLDNFGIILSSEQRFGLSDLQAISIATAKRIDQSSVIGLTIGSFGLSKLKQQLVALSYARQLSRKLSLSLSMDLFRLDANEFGSTNRFSFQLGSCYKVSESIIIGLLIKNPVSSEINDTSQLGSVYSFGFQYIIDDKVQFYSQLSKLHNTPLDWRNGISYSVHEALNLRVGFSSSPSTIHFGVGIRLAKKLNMDAAFYRHETLGLTPVLSVVFED